MTRDEIKDLLDEAAARINHPDFIADDPVQFPRMFTDKRDIEIAALLASTVAWGKRSMICRDASAMFALMDWQPYRYVADGGFEELPDCNIHRTFFARNLRHYLRGLRVIYERYGTLDDFASATGASDSAAPAWHLADAINRVLADANSGIGDSRCLPLNMRTTALKRFNMALRWLVRRDGIVDLGIWQSLTPAQLYIPLDVHVGNIARQLGLLTRSANDRRAVGEITAAMRTFNPADPALYDFALFGLGVRGELQD